VTPNSKPNSNLCYGGPPVPKHLANWTKHNVVLDCGQFAPLREKMTSSIKPEVHNVLHCRQKKNRATATGSK